MNFRHSLLLPLLLLTACSQQPLAPIDYVDPFIGTGFHGHTYPGATVPFGAVQLSPDTRRGNWDACSGYHYDDSTLIGFSHTHLSGTGCIDLGDILFRPTTRLALSQADGQFAYSPTTFSHREEEASAGYYAVTLTDEKIRAELTATTHVGMHRYTYPQGATAGLIVDLAHLLDNETINEVRLQTVNDREIEGMRITTGWVANQPIHFVASFSHPFTSARLSDNGRQLLLEFAPGDAPLVAKVGLSLVSVDNARENLKHEVPDYDFDAVRGQARQTWEAALGAITVEGGTREELTNFYTALYHSLLAPNVTSDVNGQFLKHDGSVGQLPAGKKHYSTFSLWDTFRAWHPLMTLTDHALVDDMVHSLLRMYESTGELPIWPLAAGETGTMIGYHSASVIADAYLKGIGTFDAEQALQAMIASSEKNKKGADFYTTQGFIPSNIKRESVSCLLEFAYDDWCIARMASTMGRSDVAERYMARAQHYVNVFDGSTGFFRGKRSDGNWESPFDPFEVGRAYTEATAWQYRFFVPHDVYGLTQLFGGREPFIAALDTLFATRSQTVGELSDITGLIGQYAHGNEPSHHMAYLYSYVAQPWKTQAMTRRLLHEMYQPTPQGIVGNEDCGQMSAWYICTALGIYPVCPGSNEFVLTSPLFEKATVKLAGGKQLVITANNPARNTYIEKVELNGRPIDRTYLTYAELMEGGELRFTLTDRPCETWGVGEAAAPHSATLTPGVAIPYTTADLNLFLTEVAVPLGTTTPDARIYYTLDGSEPSEVSARYTSPLKIDRTLTLKVKAFKPGLRPSPTLSLQATKAVLREPMSVASGLTQGVSYAYYEGKFARVSEIEQGTLRAKGIMSEPSIKEALREDHYGYVFTGLIHVPEDGVYTFQTRTDDGSALYIGDAKVVDNDGSHAAVPATGMVALKKGYHPYKLFYFEDYEGQHLEWAWKLPSAADLAPIPTSELFIR